MTTRERIVRGSLFLAITIPGSFGIAEVVVEHGEQVRESIGHVGFAAALSVSLIALGLAAGLITQVKIRRKR